MKYRQVSGACIVESTQPPKQSAHRVESEMDIEPPPPTKDLLSYPNLQHNPPHPRPLALKDNSPLRAEPLNFTHKLVHPTPYAEVDFLRRDPGFRTFPV